MNASIFSAPASRRHNSLPVARSRQSVHSFPPSNAVRKMRSRQMHGDDGPEGVVTCQSTFFSGPNSTGGFSPSALPAPSGPRKRGHFASPAKACRETSIRTTVNSVFMGTHLRRMRSICEQRCCVASRRLDPRPNPRKGEASVGKAPASPSESLPLRRHTYGEGAIRPVASDPTGGLLRKREKKRRASQFSARHPNPFRHGALS
jgi:hypothetical protein